MIRRIRAGKDGWLFPECVHCGEGFVEGDELFEQDWPAMVFHVPCLIRTVTGGFNHQTGSCTCCGGDQPPDPPGMTPREAAELAVAEYRRQNPGKGL